MRQLIPRWRRALRGVLVAAAVMLVAAIVGGNATAANASVPSMWLYTGVWEPGSGAQHWNTAMTYDQFLAQDTAYFNQGLRITDFEVENGKYTAVWRPGVGAQHWWPGLTQAQFMTKDKAYFDAGLRLVALEIDAGAYYAVWRSGSGAQHWWPGLTWAAFKTQDQTYFDQGLRLTDVEVEGNSVWGVWRSGSGAQYWKPNMTPESFLTANQQYTAMGLSVKIMKVKAGLITAVWAPSVGTQVFRFGLSLSGMLTEDTAFFNAGKRFRALEVHQVPVSVYRLPFDAGDTDWVVSNGNWDDTINGHGMGDPNSSQGYAYDFMHDFNHNGIGESGQNVRAARAGVVIAMAEDRTINTWGLQPGDPGYGAPGEGNFVMIKHADGSSASYCHLQYNQVSVTVGQQVAQGQVIGLSGNTGNSSTPHVHMDVRTYWNSANSLGPTVPTFFQDANHTAWRPAVGELLSSNNS